MIVCIDSRFEKDTDKISNKNLSEKIAQTIEEVRKCNHPGEIRNLKKMQAAIPITAFAWVTTEWESPSLQTR